MQINSALLRRKKFGTIEKFITIKKTYRFYIYVLHDFPALFFFAESVSRTRLSISNFVGKRDHLLSEKDHSPLAAESGNRERAVAGVVPRRRPPGAVPRVPNNPRTCPWSVLPPSLLRVRKTSSPPRQNGISRARCLSRPFDTSS